MWSHSSEPHQKSHPVCAGAGALHWVAPVSPTGASPSPPLPPAPRKQRPPLLPCPSPPGKVLPLDLSAPRPAPPADGTPSPWRSSQGPKDSTDDERHSKTEAPPCATRPGKSVSQSAACKPPRPPERRPPPSPGPGPGTAAGRAGQTPGLKRHLAPARATLLFLREPSRAWPQAGGQSSGVERGAGQERERL